MRYRTLVLAAICLGAAVFLASEAFSSASTIDRGALYQSEGGATVSGEGYYRSNKAIMAFFTVPALLLGCALLYITVTGNKERGEAACALIVASLLFSFPPFAVLGPRDPGWAIVFACIGVAALTIFAMYMKNRPRIY